MKHHRLIEQVHARKQYLEFLDKNVRQYISNASLQQVAEDLSLPVKAVTVEALNENIIPLRFIRNFNTLNFTEQKQLVCSRVAIVGLGGLGGYVAENLTRMGVGYLTLIDDDIFDETNLNRQILCTQETIGLSKAKTAAARLKTINSELQINIHNEKIFDKNALYLLQNHDVIIDCLDSIETRLLVSTSAQSSGIPLISAAVAGMFGQITTVYPYDKGLEIIYGDQTAEQSGAEQNIGCMPFTVMLMAALQCAEALRLLTGKPALLRNRLMIVDLMDYTLDILALNSLTELQERNQP